MLPADQGRFCNSCQKAVVDFSGMSDAQLIAFFKKPSTGSVCGRFNNDQLERDIRIPGKRMPWLKHFLQLMIPVLFISVKARSQGKPVITGDTVLVTTLKSAGAEEKCLLSPEPGRTQKISGRLVDDRGLPIPHGTVVIKGTNRGVVCDVNGNFNLLPNSDAVNTTLVFSSVGFTSKEVVFDTNKSRALGDTVLVRLSEALAGEVVIVGFVVPRKKPPVKIFQRLLRDTVAKFFKIYPNPVQAGQVIKLEIRNAEGGEYLADLINQNGQIIHSSSVRPEKNKSDYLVPTTTAGTYVLRLTNKQTRKKHVEKIVIK